MPQFARLLVAKAVAAFAIVFISSVCFGALLWFSPGSPLDEGGGGLWAWVQSFWSGVFRLDLGASYRQIPVLELLVRGAWTSLPIVACSMALSLGTALFVALVARERMRRLGRLVRGLLHAGSLLPVFLLGYLGLVLVGIPPDSLTQYGAAVLILALGDGMLTDCILSLDVEVEQLEDQDFIYSARLRGVPVWPAMLRHLGLIVAQIAADRTAYLIGGVLVLEKVFSIQGIGLIGYQAAIEGDFPLLIAITVFVTAFVACMQLAVDLASALLDPRPDRGGGSGLMASAP